MWYDGLGVISIGCQSNGPNDRGIGTIKVDLWRNLCVSCTSTHCAELDHYAIALRVGGTFHDYEKEQIWKIRRSIKSRLIGLDIDIPMSIWQPKRTEELKSYLADKVIESLQLMVSRLKSDKLTVDDVALFGEVEAAIAVFRKTLYPDMP